MDVSPRARASRLLQAGRGTAGSSTPGDDGALLRARAHQRTRPQATPSRGLDAEAEWCARTARSQRTGDRPPFAPTGPSTPLLRHHAAQRSGARGPTRTQGRAPCFQAAAVGTLPLAAAAAWGWGLGFGNPSPWPYIWPISPSPNWAKLVAQAQVGACELSAWASYHWLFHFMN